MPKTSERFAFKYETRMAAERVGEIMVYGYITKYPWDDEDISAKGFDKALKELGEVDRLNVRIHSGGGSVHEAVAMRSMLMTHKADKHFYIESLCASAATLLPSMGTVHMYEGAYFMIHRPSSWAWGTAEQMEKEHKLLLSMEEQFIAIYAKRTSRSDEEIKEWLYAETWMTAAEALENGFVDEVIEATDAVACVNHDQITAMRAMYGKMPDQLAALLAEHPREEEPEKGPLVDAEDHDHISSAAPAATENMQTGSDENVDWKDITMEQLTQERPDLANQLTAQGTAQERERIKGIDDSTVAGYEQMAYDAKHGEAAMSAGDYAMSVLKAQQQKGATFMVQRAEETSAANEVPGSDPGEAIKGAESSAADMTLARELAACVAEEPERED